MQLIDYHTNYNNKKYAKYYVQHRQKIHVQPRTIATRLIQTYQEGRIKINCCEDCQKEYEFLSKNSELKDCAIYETENDISVGIKLAVLITVYPGYVQLRYQQLKCQRTPVGFFGEKFQERVWISTNIGNNISSALTNIPISEWRAYSLFQHKLTHTVHNPDHYDSYKDEKLQQLFVPIYEFRLTYGEAILRSLLPADMPQLIAMLHQCDNKLNFTS